MAKKATGKPSSNKSVRLTPKIIKAKDPLSYRLIARQLCRQFVGSEQDFVATELAKIGTDYAAALWDKPESNELQVQNSILGVSNKARRLLDELLHLGPLARLAVYGEWLPDPDEPSLSQRMGLGSGTQTEPGIDEPFRFKERQMDAFFSSPEIQWLMKMRNLGEKWKPLRESYGKGRAFAKRPTDEPRALLRDQCKWLIGELGRRGNEQKYQYALTVHGLAGKIFEVVTGKKASEGQFR